MSTDEKEYGVPIIFDVTAHSREAAGEALVEILSGHQLPGNKMRLAVLGEPRIESWWTLEGVDKELDRNDNDPGVVVFRDDLDYLYMLLATTGPRPEDAERHERLRRYFYVSNRVGWADTEEVA